MKRRDFLTLGAASVAAGALPPMVVAAPRPEDVSVTVLSGFYIIIGEVKFPLASADYLATMALEVECGGKTCSFLETVHYVHGETGLTGPLMTPYMHVQSGPATFRLKIKVPEYVRNPDQFLFAQEFKK